MRDRELLELAAKAAGYEIDEHERSGSAWAWVYPKGSTPDADGDFPIFKWSPLTDDGDALRLAVNLGLEIYEGIDEAGGLTGAVYFVESESRPKVAMEYHKEHLNKYSAARRAIVRAAAEIGKAMP